jgi:hypothetical protein
VPVLHFMPATNSIHPAAVKHRKSHHYNTHLSSDSSRYLPYSLFILYWLPRSYL